MVIVSEAGEELESEGMRIGDAINNIAEYRALIEGLRRCARNASRRVRCYSDSMLVVQHVLGNWRVRDSRLRALREQVCVASGKIGSVSFEHLPWAHPILLGQTLWSTARCQIRRWIRVGIKSFRPSLGVVRLGDSALKAASRCR